MTDWTEERCSSQPDEVQAISSGKIIQRRNIEKVDHAEENGMPAYTEYVCESRKMTVAEYAMLKAEEQDAAIDDLTIASLGGEA